MRYNLKLVGLLVFATAAIMLLPAGAASPTGAWAGGAASSPMTIGPASLSSPVPAPLVASPAHALTGYAATESKILSAIHASHAKSSTVFLPSAVQRFSTAGHVVTPLYSNSPAPMGLGDFGIREVNGVNVGTISYTSSVEGAVTINSVNPIYVTSSAPDDFTLQLNTVLTHTDILGTASYQYWIQNVPIYSPVTKTLSFEDNIWNFSSPTAVMVPSSVYSSFGAVQPGGYYYAPGPSFGSVVAPFTVDVWNNASVVNDRPTVFFNYTVSAGGTVTSGTYDQVEFNSSATPPTSPAPSPTFQINGKSTNPTNFLLNDAEIMLGGPGGGSTTTLMGISAQMGLYLAYNGSTVLHDVPAAYDFGTDTGETSEGIAEYATTGPHPVAMLNGGPGLLYPLWGIAGSHQGAHTVTVTLTPTNSFVWASPGAPFDAARAAWGPTATSGASVFSLAPGGYTFEFMLSDYTPQIVHVTPSMTALTVTLVKNTAEGIYTPLWAQGNAQLAAISQKGGHGTLSHPYYLDNNLPSTIDPLFSAFNDYLFPVFPGVYLIGTSDYVNVFNMPTFGVPYPSTNVGTPTYNQLNIETYRASNVSIVNNAALSGWFFYVSSFGEPAAVYLWDSNHILVADNTFDVESNGIDTVDATGLGGHNTIWGNVFNPTSVVGNSPYVLNNLGPVGMWVWESNDLIYNNAFLTPNTAFLQPANFYVGGFSPWTDSWNIKPVASSTVHTVNGWHLTGSILGLATVSGNFWQNYGTSSDPYGVTYNNGGGIYTGGDHHPLTLLTLYKLVVFVSGLPSGTTWSVTVNGYTQSTSGTRLVFWLPDGAWGVFPGAVTGFTAPAPSSVLVNGGSLHTTLVYT